MAVTSRPRPAAVAGERAVLGSRAYWANLRYLAFGRAFPACLFGFMGWLQLHRVAGSLPPASAAALVDDVLPKTLYALFCAIPVGLYLTRPRPAARDGRLVARSAAFGGTLLQLFVGAFAPSGAGLWSAPAWVGTISTIAIIAAWAFAIWALAYLRRSLSIIPEARRLTTGGPYRIVRHPLYCAEITAAVAFVLDGAHLVPLLSLGAFVALQVTRMGFEERLLRTTFPEYGAYAARTRRVVPGIV